MTVCVGRKKLIVKLTIAHCILIDPLENVLMKIVQKITNKYFIKNIQK
jgi:hypothetical protein